MFHLSFHLILLLAIGVTAEQKSYSSVESLLDLIHPDGGVPFAVTKAVFQKKSWNNTAKGRGNFTGYQTDERLSIAQQENASDSNESPNVVREITLKTPAKIAGRDIRDVNQDQWIKLTFPKNENEEETKSLQMYNTNLVKARMPRVNFVTSESRYLRESVSKPADESDNNEELRTDFVYPDNRARSDEQLRDKPANTAPINEFRHQDRNRYYDDYRNQDKHRFRDSKRSQMPPAWQRTKFDEQQRLPGYGRYNEPLPTYPDHRISRNDGMNYQGQPRKSRRIIYYATLPEVTRISPNLDLRNRYSQMDRYGKYDREFNLMKPGRYYEIYSKKRRHPQPKLSDEYRNDDKYSHFDPKDTHQLSDNSPAPEDPFVQEDPIKNESDIPPLRYKMPMMETPRYPEFRKPSRNRYT